MVNFICERICVLLSAMYSFKGKLWDESENYVKYKTKNFKAWTTKILFFLFLFYNNTKEMYVEPSSADPFSSSSAAGLIISSSS